MNGYSGMAYSEVQTVGPGQYAITGVSFDPLEDLLWTGNEGVRNSLHIVVVSNNNVGAI